MFDPSQCGPGIVQIAAITVFPKAGSLRGEGNDASAWPLAFFFKDLILKLALPVLLLIPGLTCSGNFPRDLLSTEHGHLEWRNSYEPWCILLAAATSTLTPCLLEGMVAKNN